MSRTPQHHDAADELVEELSPAEADSPVATAPPSPGLGRAVALTASASTLVPLVGLATQPLLSHVLGPEGRGTVQAAIAPGLLLGSLAALGLPEAVTYFVAKRPELSRWAVRRAVALVVGAGVLGLVLSLLALGYLSGGDQQLAELMLVALALTVPAMAMAVVKGAALGHQMWGLAASEGALSALLRLVALVVLWLTGELTVFTTVLVGTLGTLITTSIYVVPLVRRHRSETSPAPTDARVGEVLSFGLKLWLGAVASMVVARADQLLMVPLASKTDLGLYTVATTVADAPILLVLAIAGALFGVNSRSSDVDEVALTSRLSLVLVALTGGVLALGAGWFVEPLFGDGFDQAVLPTRLLLLAQFAVVPALITGTGLATQGRPELRSAALGVVLVVNVGLIYLLVPQYGVLGACWAAVISNAALSLMAVLLACRIMHRSPGAFLVPRWRDVVLIATSVVAFAQRTLHRRRRSGSWTG